MDDAIRNRLGEINPLKTLADRQRDELVAQGRMVTTKRGDAIFRQGDEDNDAVYLIEGTLETRSDGGSTRIIEAGAEASNYALGNLKPRPFSAVVASDQAVVLRVDRARVEQLAARSQMVSSEQPSVLVTDIAGEGQVDGAWMFQVLQSALFRDLPTEHIEQFLSSIERVELAGGHDVVVQGEPGDYFYMIAEGECEVMRNVNGLAFPIARLAAGDSFGEEALISGMPRNATVRS